MREFARVLLESISVDRDFSTPYLLLWVIKANDARMIKTNDSVFL